MHIHRSGPLDFRRTASSLSSVRSEAWDDSSHNSGLRVSTISFSSRHLTAWNHHWSFWSNLTGTAKVFSGRTMMRQPRRPRPRNESGPNLILTILIRSSTLYRQSGYSSSLHSGIFDCNMYAFEDLAKRTTSAVVSGYRRVSSPLWSVDKLIWSQLLAVLGHQTLGKWFGSTWHNLKLNNHATSEIARCKTIDSVLAHFFMWLYGVNNSRITEVSDLQPSRRYVATILILFAVDNAFCQSSSTRINGLLGKRGTYTSGARGTQRYLISILCAHLIRTS